MVILCERGFFRRTLVLKEDKIHSHNGVGFSLQKQVLISYFQKNIYSRPSLTSYIQINY